MAILHYQTLGKFGVNIDDGFPLADENQHEGETNIEEIAKDIEKDDTGDSDEPLKISDIWDDETDDEDDPDPLGTFSRV